MNCTSIIYNFLHKISISKVIQFKKQQINLKSNSATDNNHHHHLIDVEESTRLGQILSLLAQENILAVPVYKYHQKPSMNSKNSKNDNRKDKIYTGIISVYDILSYTCFQRVFDQMDEYNILTTKPQKKTTTTDNNSRSLLEKQVKQQSMDPSELTKKYLDILEAESAYFNTPVKELIGLTFESSESWTLYASDPITSLLQMMTNQGYHRVLILNDDVRNINVKNETGSSSSFEIHLLTQTDLVKFLFNQDIIQNHFIQNSSIAASVVLEKYLQLFDLPLNKVGELARTVSSSYQREHDIFVDPNQNASTRGKQHVIKVNQNYDALNAFRVLYNHHVSAIAVVNDHNGLVANLSASDLRGITNENLENLLLPVFQYLGEGEWRGKDQLRADQIRSLTMKHHFVKDAVDIIMKNHIHRIWLVDDNEAPVSVVTLTDLLTLFAPFGEPPTE